MRQANKPRILTQAMQVSWTAVGQQVLEKYPEPSGGLDVWDVAASGLA